MCVLDSNGNCDALSSDAWFKDDVTLAIKYSNGKVVENASFNWTSTSGLSSTESKVLTNTEDALVNMSTYRCEVTIDQEDGKKLQGEVSSVVGIDKQFPVIEEAAAECERNIEMINYMNDLIDQVGLDYIQSIIDKNDAIAASKLMLKFFKGGK